MKAKVLVLFLSLSLFSDAWAAQNAASVIDLKSQILTLAKSYEGQTDPDGSKTKSLQVLIDQLLQATPARSMADKAKTAVGAWRQVWGPYSYNDSKQSGLALQSDSIYQVITDHGIYTNVGVYDFFGLKIVGVLRGKYRVQENQIDIKFIEDGILIGDLPDGKTLADVPSLKDQGQILVADFPSIFPPVGIKGELIETYSDEDLRITYGVQNGQPGQTLYILERVIADQD